MSDLLEDYLARQTYHLTDLRLSTELPGFMHWLPHLERIAGKCAVANGCFDILHPGHLTVLSALARVARQMGLRPVVALNSDSSVRTLKGPSRPIVPQAARSALINSLEWPLTVVLFDEETPQLLMDTLRPVVVVKGSEYAPDSVVRWSGSQVITVDMVPKWSTSRIIGDAG
jgi:D-beta-D-heptose 7-phosphate kinase/D-beta-D-heptose 1-phosphate adenosyltransferase